MKATMGTPPTPADSPGAARYNRIQRWLGILDFVLGLALLVVLLATGWTSSLRDLSYRAAFQNYSLAVFFYLVMLLLIGKILGFGLDFYGFRLEHKFQLSNQKLRSWLLDEVKGFLVGVLLGGVAVEVLYFILRQFPQHWWLIAWAAFLGLFVLMAQLAPVVLFPIFYKFEPLDNDDLKTRLLVLSERAGTRVRGVYKWNLSEKSKKANAALTGLGNTRRIILADTLLENYSADEIEAVLAHELGHHVHRHILKSIAVQALVTLAGFWAANYVLRYAIDEQHMFQHLADFANLPLLALVASGLSLLLMPALNAYSRFTERQADLYCWKCVSDVTPYITAMEKLGKQNLSESHPSRIVELLFHSHPPISKRIAAAEAWAKNHRPSLAT